MFANINPILYIMTNKSSILLTALMMILAAVTSCGGSDSDDQLTPIKKQKFSPKDIVIKKAKGEQYSEEKWTDITIDKNGDISSYEYSFEKDGVILEKRKFAVNNFDSERGIMTANMTIINSAGDETKLFEIVKFKNGLITEIETYTTEGNNDEITTQKFRYEDAKCIEFSYENANYKVTRKYNWGTLYKLDKMSEDFTDLNNGKNETNEYKYTFSKDQYPYEGLSMFPFIISERNNNVFPNIYAALGYFGIETPYIMQEAEIIKKSLDFGTATAFKINNTYSLIKKNSRGEVTYDISSRLVKGNTESPVYDEYTITLKE